MWDGRTAQRNYAVLRLIGAMHLLSSKLPLSYATLQHLQRNHGCREGKTRIQSLEFTGCKGDSAVLVDVRSGDRTDALRVSFDHVTFSDNGQKRGYISGGAVRVESCFAKSCTRPAVAFRNCRFSRNYGMYGGAISVEDARLRIEDSVFQNNEADLSGGAVYAYNQKGSVVRMTDTLFEHNLALADARVHLANESELLQTPNQKLATVGMGGAVFAHSPNKFKMLRCTFAQNKGCRGGGAMRVSHEDLPAMQNATFVFNVSESVFENNTAFCNDLNDVFRFSRTRFARLGGAILYESQADINSNWTLDRTELRNNVAWSGGALSIQSVPLSVAQHRIASCTFEENHAVIAGGGLVAIRAQVVMLSTTIQKSRALAGAGITLWSASSLFTLPNPLNASRPTIIENCESIYGAGISADVTSSSLTASALLASLRVFALTRCDGSFELGGAQQLGLSVWWRLACLLYPGASRVARRCI